MIRKAIDQNEVKIKIFIKKNKFINQIRNIIL